MDPPDLPNPTSTTPPESPLMRQLHQQIATIDALLSAGRTTLNTQENQ